MSEHDVTTIHDFVDRRWHDAKCELRQSDSQFVDKMESTVRLQALGLYTPWEPDLKEKPKKGLSKQWHRLLEACTELMLQVSRVQVAVDSLSANAYRDMLPVDVGKQVNYHFSSLIILTDALSKQVNNVIRKTIEMYVDDEERAKKLSRQYQERVNQPVRDLNKQRNSLLHCETERSFAKGITEEELWESGAAMVLPPQERLDQYYALECERLRSGVYVDAATMGFASFFGSILGDLEKVVQRN